MDSDLRFAILIDADNISDKYIKVILDETANNGIATYKRIYGDWGAAPGWLPGKTCYWPIPLSPCSNTATPPGKMLRILP